jgi:hypothetical protein
MVLPILSSTWNYISGTFGSRLALAVHHALLKGWDKGMLRATTSGGAAVKADNDDRNVATRVGRCSQSFSKHHHAALEQIRSRFMMPRK